MNSHLLLVGLSSFNVQGLRIAIASVWTLAALIAASFHWYNFREARKNQHAVRNSGPLGVEIALMLVRMEQDRLLKMLILAAVGIMALAGPPYQGMAGWGLLALPFIGVWGSLVDRRSRARQAAIVAANIVEQLVAKKVIVEPAGDVVIARPDEEIKHLPDGTEVPPPPPAA